MLTVQAPPTAFDMQVQRWTRASPDYPRELNDLAHPPRELYTIGRTSTLSIPRVAIVGTRNSTAYGERITRTLTRALV
ncbi:MAG TPA: DNA-processing protein DprA, partial [Gemmatimonadaceae bacterium]